MHCTEMAMTIKKYVFFNSTREDVQDVLGEQAVEYILTIWFSVATFPHGEERFEILLSRRTQWLVAHVI